MYHLATTWKFNPGRVRVATIMEKIGIGLIGYGGIGKIHTLCYKDIEMTARISRESSGHRLCD